MPRFVAREDDLGGVAALKVLATVGCSTASLNGDGMAGPRDTVFFTGDSGMHWPSKWLRNPTGQRRHNFVPPSWARDAMRVIAIRPGKDFTADGFEAAILSVAQSLGAVQIPPKEKKRGPIQSRRAYALRPYSY